MLYSYHNNQLTRPRDMDCSEEPNFACVVRSCTYTSVILFYIGSIVCRYWPIGQNQYINMSGNSLDSDRVDYVQIKPDQLKVMQFVS